MPSSPDKNENRYYTIYLPNLNKELGVAVKYTLSFQRIRPLIRLKYHALSLQPKSVTVYLNKDYTHHTRIHTLCTCYDVHILKAV